MVNGVGGSPPIGPNAFGNINSFQSQPQSPPAPQPAPQQQPTPQGNGIMPAATAAAVMSAVSPNINRPLSANTLQFLDDYPKTIGSINDTLNEVGIQPNSTAGQVV